MAPLTKTKEIIKKLPEHKGHLDFLAALLTPVVLITVILLNLGNLQNTKSKNATSPTPSPKSSPITVIEKSPSINAASCTKGIGPIDVSYPQEGQTVSDNPLCIGITYTQGNYCAASWAYKINGGSFSDYSNNSVCLYNLPQGNNSFILQVKSQVNSDQKTIERHFIYNGVSNGLNSPTPIATSAAQ